MTPTKMKTMGDVLFEWLLMVGGSPANTDILGVGALAAGSLSAALVNPATPLLCSYQCY